MDERIVGATIQALHATNHVRFFKSERGYQGRFFCALQAFLDEHGVLSNDVILEMEYQKSTRHVTHQRPDIILHIPAEVSGAAVDENNFAVWALKRLASVAKACEDFDKLDEMFEYLHYPLGFFININTDSHHLNYYTGCYRDRLLAFAVRLNDGNISIKLARWLDGQVIEEQL